MILIRELEKYQRSSLEENMKVQLGIAMSNQAKLADFLSTSDFYHNSINLSYKIMANGKVKKGFYLETPNETESSSLWPYGQILFKIEKILAQ